MANTYILLGSNLGESKNHISDAISAITSDIGLVTAKSSLYQTAAWGKTDQPDFINQVIEVKTELDPSRLLESVLLIEKKLGRERYEKWGSRIIDIDVLFYDNEIVCLPNLTIPHPYLHLRRFTLLPLNELNSDFIHPVLKESISHLLFKLDDNLFVEKVEI
jgi:2-amino-4-hydroxy-6-hydroxymethyldihydropteridine diphosphokinase